MAPSPRSDGNGTDGGALRGARVLLVEDDFLISMELEYVLRDAGAEILGPCRSVSEALKLAEDADIAAAVLDLRLGRELIDPVPDRLSERGVPFVFYTGQTESDPVHGRWPDAKFVQKPAPSRVIVEVVAEAIRR